MSLIILGSLIALPVLVPYMLISSAFRERKIQRQVDRSNCINCGALLGKQSIVLADNFRTEDALRFREDHPNARRAMGPKIVAICSACNTAHCFNDQSGAFVLSGYQPTNVLDKQTRYNKGLHAEHSFGRV